MVVYLTEADYLRGGLVEIGYGLSLNKRIYITGDKDTFIEHGTIWEHPLISDCTHLSLSETMVHASTTINPIIAHILPTHIRGTLHD